MAVDEACGNPPSNAAIEADHLKLDPIAGSMLWHFAQVQRGGGGKTAA